tara:strand:+ start:78 stop:308 length:231 start_codon:yes stop_codon:yes gene_type:complete
MNMNIDDLKDKIKTLERAKDAVEYVLHYISEVEGYCSQVGVEGSHHGEMEYEDVLCRIEDELSEIENALEQLGVTL